MTKDVEPDQVFDNPKRMRLGRRSNYKIEVRAASAEAAHLLEVYGFEQWSDGVWRAFFNRRKWMRRMLEQIDRLDCKWSADKTEMAKHRQHPRIYKPVDQDPLPKVLPEPINPISVQKHTPRDRTEARLFAPR